MESIINGISMDKEELVEERFNVIRSAVKIKRGKIRKTEDKELLNLNIIYKEPKIINTPIQKSFLV